MKIGPNTPYLFPPQRPQPESRSGVSGFEAAMKNEAAQQRGAAGASRGYDFSSMTRQEIADAGKGLFQAGEISLDELFQFDHADGRFGRNGGFRVGLEAGGAYSSGERIDFIGRVRKSVSDMEQTGEALRNGPHYELMKGLLEKLAAASWSKASAGR